MRSSMKARYQSSGDSAFGFLVFLVTLWSTLGFIAAKLFEYILWSLIHKDIPWYADLVAGVVSSPVLVPATVICWILRLCGVEAPFFHIS